MGAIYLDSAATTQIDPRVADLVLHYLKEEFGNAGSRTHSYGSAARSAVEHAREQVAAVVEAGIDEVIFTSGATESDNIAILGTMTDVADLAQCHIVSDRAEHKAVLEPIEHLVNRGCAATFLDCEESGRINIKAFAEALRPDTRLVSIMHVNNETGVCQPLAEICDLLKGHQAILHVDAAQGFGKEIETLRNKRIDLISISGHKIYGPNGVGALITRKRNGRERLPITPLMYGGGQERNLRPGTLPVPLIAGLGLAAELALKESANRWVKAQKLEKRICEFVFEAGGTINGDRTYSIPFILNASFPGLDSEAFIVATKDLIAISNGAACSSSSYDRSHVLEAMGIKGPRLDGAVRFSWSHVTEEPDFKEILRVLQSISF
jgi:cysteine desulfurase